MNRIPCSLAIMRRVGRIGASRPASSSSLAWISVRVGRIGASRLASSSSLSWISISIWFSVSFSSFWVTKILMRMPYLP